MKSEKCVLVGASSVDQEMLKKVIDQNKNCYTIGVDRGYNQWIQIGVIPDLVIGDFDSIDHIPEHPNLIQLPTMKDDTDILAAIKKGIELGCKEFHIFGGLGGRPDHSYANIALLSYIRDQNGKGFLYGEGYTMTLLQNERISFPSTQAGICSVFAFTDICEGVTIKNLKYELNQYRLQKQIPIGVSNEFIGKDCYIEVKNGKIIVMWENL